MKSQNNIYNYPAENELAKKILGESDYNSLNRIFKWLKYESVGEYIYYEAIEWPEILRKNTNFRNTTFLKKQRHFLFPTIPLPRFRLFRSYKFSIQFPHLLYELRKGLLEEVFKNEQDFRVLVNYFNDFRSLMANLDQDGFGYQKYLILGEALLEKKRQELESTLELVPPPMVQEQIIDQVTLTPLSEQFVVPFPPVERDFLPKIQDCALALRDIGLDVL